MARKPKQPTKPPADAREHILTHIRAIAEGKEKPGKEDRVVYRVSGGPPSRRLDLKLEIFGTGSMNHHLLDELDSRHTKRSKSHFSSDKVLSIFKRLVESRLLENLDTGGGFLPDSVIGSITVASGRLSKTYYFLADENQRRHQAKPLNPSLAAMLDLFQDIMNERKS
jgi:hypothetical protein